MKMIEETVRWKIKGDKKDLYASPKNHISKKIRNVKLQMLEGNKQPL